MEKVENTIIIGGGPAGLAAATYLGRAGLSPLVFTGSPPGGQLMLTTEVENFPGHESILGPFLIDNMRKQALRFKAMLIDENITSVKLVNPPFEVTTGSGKIYRAKTVLVATGAKALWLNLPSEQRLRGKGISACATCDAFFFKNKTVAVIGGGDSALEEALTLTKFASKVYIIHRRDSFKASKIMQQRVFEHKNIEVIWNAAVAEVKGEAKVEGLLLKVNGADRELPLDGVFVAIGHKPDTDLYQGVLELDQKGYIITTLRAGWDLIQGKPVKKELFRPDIQTMTSVAGVFAAGDCVDYVHRQAATASGMGVAASLDIERYLEAQP